MEIVEIPENMVDSVRLYALETARGDRGNKVFELSNHLGNVLATVSYKKLGRVLDSTSLFAAYYEGQVRSVQDYYAFGWNIPSRKFNTGSYRHGFNGKENDSDFGEQLIQDYGFRIYNPSVGKFLSVDPLSPDYPMLTPYQFASNSPITSVDLDGLEASPAVRFAEGFSEPFVGTIKQITINALYPLQELFLKPKVLSTIDPTGGDLVYPGLSEQGIQFSQTTYGQAIDLVKDVIPGIVNNPEYRNRVLEETGRSINGFLEDLDSGDPRAIGYAAGLATELIIGDHMIAPKVLNRVPENVLDNVVEMAARARDQPLIIVQNGFNPFSFLKNLFKKEATEITPRMGRDGKAIEVKFEDGSVIDINKARVKEWEPNKHPKAPPGTLQKKKFPDFLPGSKGYKRRPTNDEMEFLDNYDIE